MATQRPSKKARLTSEKSEKAKGKEKAVEEQQKHTLPRAFTIVAGSYEKLLYGIRADLVPDEGKDGYSFALKPIFMFPAHVSCIKAVSTSPGPQGGKWLATGSADEIIKVWDLRRRKEVGGLMHHTGSITHLTFPSRSHLLSASEDGTLALFHARDWTVLRTFKGHKGRVNAVAVHPSGKLALSVGKDATLRMWDLMRGKGVASTKLGKEGEKVCWNTRGSMFVVQTGRSLDVYSTTMELVHVINHPSRIHDITFYQGEEGCDLLLVGAEDRKVSVYAISSSKTPRILAELIGHENRVKAVQIMDIDTPTGTKTTIACTVSSDGRMHVYDLLSLSTKPAGVVAIEPAAHYDTQGTRLTCIAVAEAPSEDVPRLNDEAGDKPKRKRSESDSEGSNSESDGLNGARGVAKEDQETSEEDEEGEGEEEEEEWEGLSA